MLDISEMMVVCGAMSGYTWVQLYTYPLFTVTAKVSMYASLGQNIQLEQDLMNAYKKYLIGVASCNNGMY